MSTDHLGFLQGAPREAAQIASDHVTLHGDLHERARDAAMRFDTVPAQQIAQRRDEAVAKLHQDSMGALDGLEQRAAQSRQAVERAATPTASTDTADLTLHELQRARVARTLDRGSTVDQVAAAAGSTGDRATLNALRAEVGSRNLAPDQVEQATRAIDQAEEPHLTDGERSAREAMTEVADAWPRLETTIAHARAYVESNGREGGPLVPDWPRGATISLNPGRYPSPDTVAAAIHGDTA